MFGITGATGVLGKLLVKLLEEKKIDFSIFDGDIRNKSEIATWVNKSNPTKIIHLAAIVPITKVNDDPVTTFDVNVTGTNNLLSVCTKLKNFPWILYASTSHVYQSQREPISEDDAVKPQNIYAETKLLGEHISGFYSRHAGLDFCIARIFSFYHDSQTEPFLYPSIRVRLQKHDRSEAFELRGGNDIRDISNANDIVSHIFTLANKKYSGTINIGSGRGTRIKDFVQNIGGDNLKISIDQQNPPTSIVADISRLRKLINEH